MTVSGAVYLGVAECAKEAAHFFPMAAVEGPEWFLSDRNLVLQLNAFPVAI